jgi:hypothetical protein
MNEQNQILIYQTEDGQTQVDVRMENETVWLTINQMAMLFDREESNIRRHVINVFKEGELDRENNVHFLHVNGVKKPVPYYNLDVIISVGYRVKSQRGVKFRQWANRILKQYLVNVKCQSTSSTSGMNKHVETLHQTWLSLQLNPVFFKKRPPKMTDDR